MYYAGGARVPYTSGRKSPGGLTPFLIPAAAAVAFFPGIWLYGAYAYRDTDEYIYYNTTRGRNQSIPIVCLCQKYSVCGCADNKNSTYLNSVLGVSNYTELPSNSSTVRVADDDGTTTIFINGTLPNGTTARRPYTGSDSGPVSGSSPSPLRELLNFSGYWLMVSLVIASIALL